MKRYLPAGFALSALCLALLPLMPVRAEVYFNPALLATDGQAPAASVDLSRFEAGGQQPGVYRAEVFLNGQFISARDVRFVAGDSNTLQPSLTLKEYRELGLSVAAMPALKGMNDDEVLAPLADRVPGARAEFRFSEQRLDITIPQALLDIRARGYVDPQSWDHGVPAALLDYTVNGDHTTYQDTGTGSSNSLFASLRSGINLAGWRARNYSTWTRSGSQDSTRTAFSNISSYLARDIPGLKGQLTIGDTSTPGDVFDSVSFRGVQLASDDGMLPDSLRGFAPVIHGIAHSDAQIIIRQNGSIIYQAAVPAGPFTVSDLYPAVSSGDLQVTIREADGTERSFTQPWSSVAVMQREGQMRYALTAGELQDGSDTVDNARFVQGSVLYGMPHDITPYGGLLMSPDYMAASLGLGVGLGSWGALSADITHARATPTGQKETESGQSFRARYSKSLVSTGTTVTLAAYRYSTQGYYSFQDASTRHVAQDDWHYSTYRPRSESQLTLNQQLGDYGSLYFSGSRRDFWQRSGQETTWSGGYSTSLAGINYSLSASQTDSQDTRGSERHDRSLGLNVSVPLSRFLPQGNTLRSTTMSLNTGIHTTQDHRTSAQAGVSGSLLDDHQLSYSLSQSTGNQGQGYGASAGLTYSGRSGEISAGYNRSKSQQQMTWGLRGGMVAHPHGLTFGPTPGETFAVVRAPDASGVKVNNHSGLKTDWRGYALVPGMTPYRRNEIVLDPSEASRNVMIDMTSATVTPTRGAVVMADYRTQVGRQAMFRLTRLGKPLPFGALASVGTEEGEDSTGIVGDDGQLFMSGLPEEGELVLQGQEPCRASFLLPPEQDNGLPASVTAECR